MTIFANRLVAGLRTKRTTCHLKTSVLGRAAVKGDRPHHFQLSCTLTRDQADVTMPVVARPIDRCDPSFMLRTLEVNADVAS